MFCCTRDSGQNLPATKLVRIHAAKDGEYADWRDAKAEVFSARSGWIDYPTAQERYSWTASCS